MRLKDVTEFCPAYEGELRNDMVAFVPMEALRYDFIAHQEISFAEARGKYTYFADGDVLFAKVTPCFENGNIAVAQDLKGGIGFGSSEIFVLRARPGLNNRYLFYVVQASPFRDGGCATMCGVGGLKRMSPLFPRTFEWEIPNEQSQRRIVSYLDEKTAAIDERVALLEKKLAAYKRLKTSVINRAVTRGLDPKAELKDSGVDWIGKTPAEWSSVRIEKLLKEVNVKNTPLRTTTILSLMKDIGVIPHEEKGNVGNKAKAELEAYKVAFPNTIVANSMNILIGSVGLSKWEGCVSPVYYVFRAKKGVDIRYVNYIFSQRCFQHELRKYATGILEIRLRVSASDILKREVEIPSLSEQREIVHYLDAECAKIDKMAVLVTREIELYKKLKHSLINEVVTGKRKVA